MRAFMALGVVVWVGIAVWSVRLAMGLEHPGRDQIVPGIVGGIGGGVSAWLFVARGARRRGAE